MRELFKNRFLKLTTMFVLALISMFVISQGEVSAYTDDYVCISNRLVRIIPNKPTLITNYSAITADDVENGHIPFPDDVEEEDKDLYEFKIDTSMNKACKIKGSTNGKFFFELCPTAFETSAYSISNITSSSNMIINYNQSTGKYDITFKNASALKISMAGKINGIFEITSLGEPKTTIAKDIRADGNGNITISLNPGTEFYFVFYLNSGICEDSRLGYYQGAVPSTVPNPYYKAGICQAYTNAYTEGSLGAGLVPDCYKETIDSSYLPGLNAKITTLINQANTLLASRVSSSINENITRQCQFNDINNTKINNTTQTYTYSDFLDLGQTLTYWKAYCTETITMNYDSPQAVNAGAGFAYSANISMKRTCKPVQVATPQYYPLCNYSIECYGGPAGHTGEPGAGPTTEFDQCINTCDGGKYSQDCINKCNNEVYKDALGMSSDLVKYGIAFLTTTTYQDAKAIKLATSKELTYDSNSCSLVGRRVYTRLPQSSCNVQDDNKSCGGNGSTYCVSTHGVRYTYLDGCNANGSVSGTKCYEVFVNYPCVQDNATNRINYMGSSSIAVNPLTVYQQKVKDATDELAYVESVISQYSNTSTSDEGFKAIIKDSYTNKDVTLNALDISAKNSLITKNLLEVKQIATPIGSVTDVNRNIYEYTVSRDIVVNLPKAYVPSFTTTDQVKYHNNGVSKDPSTAGTDKLYYDGGNKYYTNIYSTSVNSYMNWRSYTDFNNQYVYNEGNSASISDYSNNISLVFNNIGSWNQLGNTNNKKNVTINCFYGVVNKYCVGCGGVTDTLSLTQTCNPLTDICTSGIQYVFRTISLSDMFPSSETFEDGRDPRWNWSNGSRLTLLGDKIDPVKYTSEVEDTSDSKHNIYSSSNADVGKDTNIELDYEIFLSKENIKNIKYYNSTKSSFLEFDSKCIKNANGKVVYESDFIGDSNYMTVYKKPSRSGCNNNLDSDTCED